jgi:hypothetical protein
VGGTWDRRGKCTGFRWESPKERDHSEDGGVDGRIGSEWILGRLSGVGGGWRGMALVGSEQGPGAVSCKYGDDPSGSGATELLLLLLLKYLNIASVFGGHLIILHFRMT